MTKIKDGDTVAILYDAPDLGLKIGDTGIIFTTYDPDDPGPKVYEVRFRHANGIEYDMTMGEDEIEFVSTEEPVK